MWATLTPRSPAHSSAALHDDRQTRTGVLVDACRFEAVDGPRLGVQLFSSRVGCIRPCPGPTALEGSGEEAKSEPQRLMASQGSAGEIRHPPRYKLPTDPNRQELEILGFSPSDAGRHPGVGSAHMARMALLGADPGYVGPFPKRRRS